MHTHILLAVDPDLENVKAIDEVEKLSGPSTIVTLLHVIGEQDVQASVRLGTHVNELKHLRSEKMASTKKRLEAAHIQYEEIIDRGNPKEKIVAYANSGRYEIVVLSNRKAEENKKFVLGSVSHKVAKRAKIPVLIVK
ncbi:universal stress protein [Staphylococcus hyicus]|uniref:universal stress protein n=1 Tax=Staphylococcus hyicus TaxID=1284 RepID=UPI0005800F1B|nr:universal stress protein [Staphylococcus hyicus]AJC95961.1 universal stress protein family protein [Staphylococcus hyicus]MCE5154795.1 universal stress protein [Staphylococcus hyicus]MCQ9299695.1 universal stress protein [Staphylococcus hyicus]MDP4448153.1 universal stress protein [Staphylococcus hyicus]MDP4468508.1 universal stress protein [Staphylococcus hyicus]